MEELDGHKKLFAALVERAGAASSTPWHTTFERANSSHFVRIAEDILGKTIVGAKRAMLLSLRDDENNFKLLLGELSSQLHPSAIDGISARALARKNTNAKRELTRILASLDTKFSPTTGHEVPPYLDRNAISGYSYGSDLDEMEDLTPDAFNYEALNFEEENERPEIVVIDERSASAALKEAGDDLEEFIGRSFAQFLCTEHPELLPPLLETRNMEIEAVNNVEVESVESDLIPSRANIAMERRVDLLDADDSIGLESVEFSPPSPHNSYPAYHKAFGDEIGSEAAMSLDTEKRRQKHQNEDDPLLERSNLQYGLIAEGIPRVRDQNRKDLLLLLYALFGRFDDVGEGDIILPEDEYGVTKGYAVIAMKSAKASEEARKRVDGMEIDKECTIRLYSIQEYLRGDGLSSYGNALFESLLNDEPETPETPKTPKKSREPLKGFEEQESQSLTSEYFYSIDNVSVSSEESMLEDILPSLSSDLNSSTPRDQVIRKKPKPLNTAPAIRAKPKRSAHLPRQTAQCAQTEPIKRIQRQSSRQPKKNPVVKTNQRKRQPQPRKKKSKSTPRRRATPQTNASREDRATKSKQVGALKKRLESEREAFEDQRRTRYANTRVKVIDELIRGLDEFRRRNRRQERSIARERARQDEKQRKEDLEEMNSLVGTSISALQVRNEIENACANRWTESERREMICQMRRIRDGLRVEIRNAKDDIRRRDERRISEIEKIGIERTRQMWRVY